MLQVLKKYEFDFLFHLNFGYVFRFSTIRTISVSVSAKSERQREQTKKKSFITDLSMSGSKNMLRSTVEALDGLAGSPACWVRC